MIETALAEMDELQVIIYDSPEVTSIPLSIRAGWLRQLYPQVGVIEAWDGPSQVIPLRSRPTAGEERAKSVQVLDLAATPPPFCP